jgi:hypothetical protein
VTAAILLDGILDETLKLEPLLKAEDSSTRNPEVQIKIKKRHPYFIGDEVLSLLELSLARRNFFIV